MRKSNAAILDRFGTTEQRECRDLGRLGLQKPRPDATADLDGPVRLAELAVQKAPTIDLLEGRLSERRLGASLYRARPVRRGDTPARGNHPVAGWKCTVPRIVYSWQWPITGRGTEAEAERHGSTRLHDHQPSADPNEFWSELEIRLLQQQGEAVILYDPVFPDDPFAQ